MHHEYSHAYLLKPMEFNELSILEESLDKTSGEGFNGGGTFIPVSPNGRWAGCGCITWSALLLDFIRKLEQLPNNIET
jgi:hypothetical protein